MRIYTRMNTHIYAHIHTHMNTHIHAYTHTPLHTCTHIRTYPLNQTNKKKQVFHLVQDPDLSPSSLLPVSAQRVIILEEDLQIAPDFFEYFASFVTAIDTDESLLGTYSMYSWLPYDSYDNFI